MTENCSEDRFLLSELLTERDVAKIMKRSVASLRRDRWLGRGCPYVKVYGSLRYRQSDLIEWLRSLPFAGAERVNGRPEREKEGAE